jgi:membrane-associated protease RseP (regulator of RpoE activity)
MPLSRVKFAVNMDMIGRLRNGRLKVVGVRTAPGLRQLVSRQNADTELTCDFDWEMKANSDHHPFFERGIPSLMLHTDLHSDYHRPSDDSEKLNVQGIQTVSQAAFRLMNELANVEELPKFRAASRNEGPANQERAELPLSPAPGRFGVSWSLRDPGPGVRLTRVQRNSPAWSAGLRDGDRLTTFQGQPATATGLGSAILASGTTAQLTYQRGAENEDLAAEATLNGGPVRVGVTWKTDDAEPGCVILTRVTPDSPAALAGLKVQDRVYSLNGQTFATSDDFRRLATQLEGPLAFTIERRGQVREVEVKLYEAP